MIKITSMITIAFMMAITGCQTTKNPVIKTQIVVVEPPANLFSCPQIKKSDIPDPNTATNRQVVEFINKLYKYNKICGINMNSIQTYISKYKKALIK